MSCFKSGYVLVVVGYLCLQLCDGLRKFSDLLFGGRQVFSKVL
jgi:hypothetical protein